MAPGRGRHVMARSPGVALQVAQNVRQVALDARKIRRRVARARKLAQRLALAKEMSEARFVAGLPCGRARRQDVLRLRTTSASLRAYSMDDVLWFAYFEHCCGCACGRCEARWLINGWICPLLYWYL